MDSRNTILSAKHERLIILGFCVIGAIRIFVFNAAFPLFNNVDEESHFDLVYKYAHGDIPKAGVTSYSSKALESIVMYRTQEYLLQTQEPPLKPPMWTIPDVQKSSLFAYYISQWRQRMKNHEAGSFPVYYAMAGLWHRAGEMSGMTGGKLIYWLRFLNIPVFVLLILVSYAIARSLYAKGDDARIALPLIVTFFPQDTFYSINNDMLSPLLFGVAFLMLVQIYNHEKSYVYHFFSGLFVAATFLTKISNIAVVALAVVMVLLKLRKSYSGKQVRQSLPKLFVLSTAAIIPIAMWLMRNYFVMGDPLGNAEKTAYSGWTVKPINQLLNHPIFTVNGIIYFLTELIETFWRGEFTWHYKAIANCGMDIFYIMSTAIFVLISCAGFFIKSKTNKEKRLEIGTSFFALIVSVLFLIALSLMFNFPTWWHTASRDHPYIAHGRLIGGMLIPFLVIYLDGLERILSVLKCRKYLIAVVFIIVIAITWSEISISTMVFKSQYNWFHMK